MKTEITVSTANDITTVKVAGAITDQTRFPNVMAQNPKKVIINLEKIAYISSGGVRGWMVWINAIEKGLNGASHASLESVPSVFMKQAYHIQNFLPRGVEISSIIVPYYCDHCQSSMDVTFKKDVDLDSKLGRDDLIKKISSTKCIWCNAVADIDGNPEDYFPL